jgi:hypothetical protein
MEVIVYAMYLIGILAAFSVLVVRVYASLPADVLIRGEHAGRFADLGAAQAAARGKPTGGSRLTALGMPKARTA